MSSESQSSSDLRRSVWPRIACMVTVWFLAVVGFFGTMLPFAVDSLGIHNTSPIATFPSPSGAIAIVFSSTSEATDDRSLNEVTESLPGLHLFNRPVGYLDRGHLLYCKWLSETSCLIVVSPDARLSHFRQRDGNIQFQYKRFDGSLVPVTDLGSR